MHENRETSEIPVVQPDRTSAGEGQSHKARAYVYEESPKLCIDSGLALRCCLDFGPHRCCRLVS